MPIDVDEMQLLAFIRIAEYEKVEIHYKDGKMDLIEGVENIKVRRKVCDLLREQKHSEVKLIQRDGKVVGVVRCTKKKIIKKG